MNKQFLTLVVLIGAVSGQAQASKFEGFVPAEVGKSLCGDKFRGTSNDYSNRSNSAREDFNREMERCRRSFTRTSCEESARSYYNSMVQTNESDHENFRSCAAAFESKLEISESVFSLCYHTTRSDNRGFGAKVAACLASLSGMKIETQAARYCDKIRDPSERRDCYLKLSGIELDKCQPGADPLVCAKEQASAPTLPDSGSCAQELAKTKEDYRSLLRALEQLPGLSNKGRGQKRDIEQLSQALDPEARNQSAR